MAKQKTSGKVLNFIAWFTGIVVSLVVGNGMIQGSLSLPSWLGGLTDAGMLVSVIIGWIVILTTLVGVVLAILKR